MTVALIVLALWAILATAALVWRLWPVPPESQPLTLPDPDDRALSDEQKAARGVRAKMAMAEFFAPAFRSIEGEYLTALTTLASNEPWATDKLTKLAVAQRVIKTVEQQVMVAVLEGETAAQSLERAKRIAALPEAKRRWVA